MSDSPNSKPRLIGINHVALEVGDIDEALAFYGRFFEFELRGHSKKMAFIDLGDQFIALSAGLRFPSTFTGLPVSRASVTSLPSSKSRSIRSSTASNIRSPWSLRCSSRARRTASSFGF